MSFSDEVEKCRKCRVQKDTHDMMIKQFGSIKFVVPLKPLIARWSSSEDKYPLEPIPYEVRECKFFLG